MRGISIVKLIVASMALLLVGMLPLASAEDSSSGSAENTTAKGCGWMTTGESAATAFVNDTSSGSATVSASSTGPLIPWWLDLVNGEPDDISVEDEDVYIAVLDTGLIPPQANYLPQDRLALTYGKGFSVPWTWDSDLEDFVAGDVYSTRGYTTRAWGSGHGTHVTSTITGFKLYGFDGSWVRGVAPRAKVIPVLVLDYWVVPCPDTSYPGYKDGYVLLGGGTYNMVAAGIKYAADLQATLDAPLIISMSLGSTKPSSVVEDAIDYAIEKGCVVVASAGNEGTKGMTWPGAFPDVISCAAGGWTEKFYVKDSDPVYNERFWRSDVKDVPEKLNSKDVWKNNKQIYLETFSSRPNKDLGQKSQHLDVTCPGASIVGPHKEAGFWVYTNPTTGTKTIYGLYPPNIYWLDGTSMAAPHASSIASMVLQNHPSADQEDIETILRKAASGETLPCDGAYESDRYWDTNGLTWHKWNGTDFGKGFLKADSALEKAEDHFYD